MKELSTRRQYFPQSLSLGEVGENQAENQTCQVADAVRDDARADPIALTETAQDQAADKGICRLNDIEMEAGEQHGLDEVRNPEWQAAPPQCRQRDTAKAQLLRNRIDNAKP